ncbi:hypothetical protein PGB90_000386 [Kerria lacca]
MILSFCGSNFGLRFLTKHLKCAVNYDLNVNVKINENEKSENVTEKTNSPESILHRINGVTNDRKARLENIEFDDMLPKIIKDISEQFNEQDTLQNLEDNFQTTIESMFANENLRNSLFKNWQNMNPFDALKNLIDERYLNTAVISSSKKSSKCFDLVSKKET